MTGYGGELTASGCCWIWNRASPRESDSVQATSRVSGRRGHIGRVSGDALELISDLGAALAHSPDYTRVLSAVGSVVVPAMADLCVVELLEHGVLAPVHASGTDRRAVSAIEDLYRRYPAAAESPQPRGRALASGDALLIVDASEDAVAAGAVGEGYRHAVKALGLRSAMLAPLVARDRVIGVITLATLPPGRTYAKSDLVTVQALARTVGLAIDDAGLDRALKDAVADRRERDSTLRLVFRQLPGRCGPPTGRCGSRTRRAGSSTSRA